MCFANFDSRFPLRVYSPRRESDGFSILGGYLVLLQFAVWHFVGPGSQSLLWKFYPVDAQRHASAKALPRLTKLLRRSQRPQAVGKILQRLLAEVAVSIIREE